MMNSQKGIGGVTLLVVIAFVAVVGGVIFYMTSDNPTKSPAAANNMNESDSTNSDMPTASDGAEKETQTDEEASENEVVVDITGQNFEFSQNEITVPVGSTVTINLTSEGGIHDWVIDEFDAATDQVQSGQTASVTFVADRKGEFEYYCSIGNHRQMGMVGTLIVE